MIRIHLDPATLARTRIAISPLAETVSALQLVQRSGPRAAWPYTDWAKQAWELLQADERLAPLGIYALLQEWQKYGPTPDFFDPVPEAPRAELAEELEALRRTPAALIKEQFARHYPAELPEPLQPFRDDHTATLHTLADALGEFWRGALEPVWPKMRAALDEEVVLRARSLASHGPESVIAGLGGRTVWEEPVLSLPKLKESKHYTVDQRLILVPLIFAQERVSCSTDHPHLLRVSYQARGAALLAGGAAAPSAAEPDRLVPLVGTRRAAVLRALEVPATTSTLAARLALAPSTVSEQLAALVASGVARRTRSGRQVFYELEPAGEVLLALFQAAVEPAAEPAPEPAAPVIDSP